MKKERGITLIALIVTIIILLILATVSINLIWNDNGIIKKAQEAKKVYTQAEIKEQLEFAIIDIQTDVAIDMTRKNLATLDDITTESISKKLPEGMNVEVGEKETTSDGKTQKVVTVIVNGEEYQYVINEDLSIDNLDENEVTVMYELISFLKSDGKSVDVKLKFICMAGIEEINFPDGTKVEGKGNTTVIETATLQINTDYKYVIITAQGKQKEKVVCVKLEELPKSPVIATNVGYPILTENGVITKDKIEIEYDKNQNLENYYSIDNGVTWKKYTEPIELITGPLIAKSQFKDSESYVQTKANIAMPTDYIKAESYDGDYSTSSIVENGKIYFDESVKGKNIRIKYKMSYPGSIALIFKDVDGNGIEGYIYYPVYSYQPDYKPYDDIIIKIPENACLLQTNSNGIAIYEIRKS